MLTQNQKEAFKKIKEKVAVEDGGLTAKQKGDFYYRMSKILKEELEGLSDLVFLLKELPDSYLEKINLPEVGECAMKLTEELVKKVGPSPYAARDEEGKYHIVRHFRVDMSGQFPGLTTATADYDISYEATKEEVEFFSHLRYHLVALEQIYESNERSYEVLTREELEKKILFVTKGRPYIPKIVGLVGSPTEETAKNIMDGKPLDEAGVPDIFDIDPKKVGLRNSRKEEPK